VRELAALLVLVLPAAAPAVGVSLEAQTGAVLAPRAESGLHALWSVGARAGLDVLREGRVDVRAELSWVRTAIVEGTRGVNVTASLNRLLLGARAGWVVGPPSLELVPYAIVGPALTLAGSSFHLADPLADTLVTPSSSGTLWGVGYGVGASLAAGRPTGLQLAARLELARVHRADAADVELTAGLGLRF
jgi:hypothetical protein